MNSRPRILYVDNLCGMISHNLFLDSISLLDIKVTNSVFEALSYVQSPDHSSEVFDVLIMSNPHSAGPWEVLSSEKSFDHHQTTIRQYKTDPVHIHELFTLLQATNPNMHFVWHHRQLPLPDYLPDVNWSSSNTEDSLREILYDLLDIEIPSKNRRSNLSKMAEADRYYSHPEETPFEKRKRENQEQIDRVHHSPHEQDQGGVIMPGIADDDLPF